MSASRKLSPKNKSKKEHKNNCQNNLGPFELNNYYVIDVLDGLSQIPDNSVNCVVTSPIYNLSGLRKDHGYGAGAAKKSKNSWCHRIDYDACSDCLPEDQYQSWIVDVLDEIERILVPNGSAFINLKNRHCGYKDFLPSDFVQKSKLNLFQEIIWNRLTSVNCAKTFFIPSFEKIFWMTKERSPPIFFRDNVPKEFCTAVWNISIPHKPKHPASFPMQIPINCILATTKENDIVLDVFAGSGTTLLAAEQLNRNYLGFDLSQNYQNMFYDETNQK